MTPIATHRLGTHRRFVLTVATSLCPGQHRLFSPDPSKTYKDTIVASVRSQTWLTLRQTSSHWVSFSSHQIGGQATSSPLGTNQSAKYPANKKFVLLSLLFTVKSRHLQNNLFSWDLLLFSLYYPTCWQLPASFKLAQPHKCAFSKPLAILPCSA